MTRFDLARPFREFSNGQTRHLPVPTLREGTGYQGISIGQPRAAGSPLQPAPVMMRNGGWALAPQDTAAADTSGYLGALTGEQPPSRWPISAPRTSTPGSYSLSG
jgi:hypothetical protein